MELKDIKQKLDEKKSIAIEACKSKKKPVIEADEEKTYLVTNSHHNIKTSVKAKSKLHAMEVAASNDKRYKHRDTDADLSWTKESIDEGELLFKLNQAHDVEKAIKGVGCTTHKDNKGLHVFYSTKKEEEALKQAVSRAGLAPIDDSIPDVSDKVRTSDADKIAMAATIDSRRKMIQKNLNRRKQNESWEDIEASLTEEYDIQALKKLNNAIRTNPQIEDALFQLISAIITNPKMFDTNPAAVIQKVSASSKVSADKLKNVVNALGITNNEIA